MENSKQHGRRPSSPQSTDRGEPGAEPLPREFAVATIALATIMIATAAALWIVTSHAGNGPGQPQSDATEQMPTDGLLEVLASDLGPTSTNADLKAAVHHWLLDQHDGSDQQIVSASPAS